MARLSRDLARVHSRAEPGAVERSCQHPDIQRSVERRQWSPERWTTACGHIIAIVHDDNGLKEIPNEASSIAGRDGGW